MSTPSGQRTSKRLLCPICNNHHGCSIKDDGAVLCLRGTSEKDAPQGYHFVKLLDSSMGGLFVPNDVNQWQASWQDKVEQRLKQRQRQQEKANKQLLLLSLEERDRQYQAVVSQLGVSEEHRQVLLKRGLTQEQIEQAKFRTWVPGKRVTGTSSSLSGIDQRGDRLVGCKGIAIPACSPLNQITGFQIKTDSGRPGKYVWLSSAKEDGSGGNGPQLPNGELPLFVWMPRGVSTEEVWLCEGGLKSAIAAYKLNKVVIGAAGGQFTTDTLQDYLKILKASRVVLAPDAGAINNTAQIPAANYKVIKLCQAWGYEVKVAWWGQQSKTKDLDIDEMLVAGRWGEIQFISPENFFNLHPVAIRERLENHTPQRAGLRLSDFPVANPHLVEEAAPLIEYGVGQRRQTWIELVQHGVRVIQDGSTMGQGKSHEAGMLQPEDLGVRQIVYVTSDPRNVTTETLRNWPINQGRHGGLAKVEGPNGTTQLRRAKEGDEIQIPANCDRHKLAEILPALNVEATGTHICPNCRFRKECAAGSGQFTYLYDRAEALSKGRFISHIDALDPLAFTGEVALVVDEPGQMGFTKSFTVRLKDLDRTLADLRATHPKEASKLEPIIEALRQRLLGGSFPLYGLEHNEVLALLPDIPNFSDEDIDRLSQQQLEFLASDQLKELGFSAGTRISDLPAEARRWARKSTQQLTDQADQAIALNWLPDFWKALHDKGRLRFNRSGLEVTVVNEHRLEILTNPAVKALILLDATESPTHFEHWLNQPVALIKQAAPQEEAEVEVIQISDLGLMGFSRGQEQQRRAQALTEGLRAKYPDAVAIDAQTFALVDDGYWYRDSRGSNACQKISTLILVGTPIPNVGALVDEFALMVKRHPASGTTLRSYTINAINTKSGGPWWTRTLNEALDAELATFIRRRTLAEIEQGIGRLRASRRPGEKLRVYFLSDYPLDRPVKLARASELVASAKGPVESTSSKVEKAIAALERKSKPVDLKSIAKLAKISLSTISRSEAWKSYQERGSGWFVDFHDAIDINSTMKKYKPHANADGEVIPAIANEEFSPQMQASKNQAALIKVGSTVIRNNHAGTWLVLWKGTAVAGIKRVGEELEWIVDLKDLSLVCKEAQLAA